MSRSNHLVLSVFCIFSIVFFPPLLFYIAKSSSQAYGAGAAALVVWAIGIVAWMNIDKPMKKAWTTSLEKELLFSATLIIFVLVHLSVSSIVHDETRPVAWATSFYSLALLAILLVTGAIGAQYLKLAPPQIVDVCGKFIVYLMLLVVAFASLGVQPISKNATSASMFPFSEPSHFALASIPFFLYTTANTKNVGRRLAVLLGLIAILPLMNRSMIFSMGILLIIGLTCPLRYIIPVCILFFIAHHEPNSIDASYYAERLNIINEEAHNLSTLVYRQGWELMAHAMESTWGWGIGFQQLGTLSPDLPATQAIREQLGGSVLNAKDGGFVMAKLVSEFGVFGILTSLTYIATWLKAAWILRSLATFSSQPDRGSGKYTPNKIMALSLYVGYGFDFFLRGVGYFSGTSMLFLVACVYLYSDASRHRVPSRIRN